MKATWVTKNEFSRAMKTIDGRFAEVDHRFDESERRLTKLIDDRQSELAVMIKAGFDDLSSQFKSHSRIIADHERRLAVVEYALSIPKK